MTVKKPQGEPDEAVQEPTQRQRRPRKPGVEKYHLYLEPDDPESESEFIMSLNGSRDPVAYIERSEDFDAGTYLIKKTRSNGQLITSFTHTKTDRPESTIDLGDEDDGTDDLIFSPEHGSDEDERTARIVAATVRALRREEQRERATQSQPNTIETLRELDDIAERRATQLRSSQPQAQQPPDIFTMVEKLVGLQQKLAPPQSNTDPEDAFVKKLQSYSKVFKIVNPNQVSDEDEGFMGKATKFAHEVREALPELRPIVAPIIYQWAMSRAQKSGAQMPPPDAFAPAPPTEPEQQPAPAPQQAAPQSAGDDDSPLTLEDVISNIKVSIQNAEPAKDSINDVVVFVTDNPEYALIVEQMMSATNQELLVLIGQATHSDVSLVVGADKFLDALRKGVRQRLRPLPAQPSASPLVSNNGDNARVDQESIQPS